MIVWAIPLAEKGFIPVSEKNRVWWYLMDYHTGKQVSIMYHETKQQAEEYARRIGLEVII